MARPRRGDLLEVVVDRLDERGRGVGRVGADSVSVRSALPGARVRATVRRRRRGAIEADLERVVEPSRRGVEPRCPYFGVCGGCSFQHLAYSAQLEELGRLLERTLAPLGETAIAPVVGCDDPWRYRNKMEFTFGARRWIEARDPGDAHAPGDAPDGFALGLHVPGRFDKVLDVERCDIAFAEALSIVADARRLARDHGLDAWDVRAHRGFLRHLVLRKGVATGDIMAVIVTSADEPARVDPYADALVARHPEISTLVHLVNPGVAAVATGAVERVFLGDGRIDEELGGLRFSLSAHTFFQTNTRQAEKLLAIVREEAAVEPASARKPSVVLDLYCGCGPLTLTLARAGARAVGVEVVDAAVDDARRNAERNGLSTRARFLAGDLARGQSLERLSELGAAKPDVCVVDPPRAGLHPRAIALLRRLAPRRIVYVSCNPKAAARDAAPLRVDGYRALRARPIDLFPHTPHLECVLTLEKASRGSSAAGVACRGPAG